MKISFQTVVKMLLLPILLGGIAEAECNRTYKAAVTGLWREADPEGRESDIDRKWMDAIAKAAKLCFSTDVPETVIARRLILLKGGTIDLLPGASQTTERASYAWFSRSYRKEAVRVYVRRPDFARFQSLKHFQDFKKLPGPFLAVRDSWLGPDYLAVRQEWLSQGRVFEFSAYRQGLTMLRNGRGQLLLAPETFSEYLGREKISDIVTVPAPIHSAAVHFMLSKASVSEAEFQQFDRALAVVIAQGGPR